jgi:hypothetical protein
MESTSSAQGGRVMFHRIQFLFFWILLAESPRVNAWSTSTFTPQWSYLNHPGISTSTSTSTSTTSSIIMMGTRGKKIRKEKRRASKEPTPPQIQTPYGPIRFNKPPRVCDSYSGSTLDTEFSLASSFFDDLCSESQRVSLTTTLEAKRMVVI